VYIQYDEFELLELFCNEPIAVHEEEAGIFIYQTQDDYGFELIMNISVYEKKCSVSLSYKDYKKTIFNFEMSDVKEIKGKDDRMIIYYGVDKAINVYFKPNFSIFKE
jgi:outer membrane receptor for Fe3+-dicitrate